MTDLPPYDPEASATRFYAPLQDAPCPARRVGWESNEAHLLRLRAIVQALQPCEEIRRVLDAGCGEGRLVDVLREAVSTASTSVKTSWLT